MKTFDFYRTDGTSVPVEGADLSDALKNYRKLYGDSSPRAVIESGFKIPKAGTLKKEKE